MKRLLLLLSTLALAGCLDSTGPSPSDPATETFASSLGVDLKTMSVTQAGTYYKDEFVGTGAALSNPTTSTVVIIDYSGYLKDGTLFDTNTGAKFTYATLIAGMIDGMLGMKVGSTRLIVIPSQLGYGNSSYSGGRVTIPANSTLVFRVKLNAIQ